MIGFPHYSMTCPLLEKNMMLKILGKNKLRALPEECDTQSSIIRHRYDHDTASPDEVYGMLRTHNKEKIKNVTRESQIP